MFRTISQIADRVLPIGFADAHCDIPCGIYDPRDAIQAAQTVIRMTELIQEMGAPSASTTTTRSTATLLSKKSTQRKPRTTF